MICERKSQIQLCINMKPNAKQCTHLPNVCIIDSNGQTYIFFWQFACLRTTTRNWVWKEYFGFDKQFIFMSYTRCCSMNRKEHTSYVCALLRVVFLFFSCSVFCFVLFCFASQRQFELSVALKGNFVRCQ